MSLGPVIGRELRASARHGSTYSFRVATVGLVLLACVFLPGSSAWGPGMGGEILSFLHLAVTLALWLFVPILAADCISRERREGTLPLLFLTPLRPREIVVAKGFAHGLRAFSLWLAAVPVLMVPFVSGGVAWQQVAFSLLVCFSSICLAISAGLIGSSVTRTASRALALTGCLAVMLLFGISSALSLGYSMRAARFVPGWPGVSADPIAIGFGLLVNWRKAWQTWPTAPAGRPLLGVFLFVTVASLAWLLIAVRLAAYFVSRTWREQPLSPTVVRLQESMTRPRYFQGLLRRWLSWQLERNPVGWLEQRRWSGRLVLWSWFAVVTCIYSSVFTNFDLYRNAFHSVQVVVANLLAGTMALSAAGSFRRERDTGVMELLLVSPLSEWQIIGGRVRGLWMQYVPAASLVLILWLYGGPLLSNGPAFGSVITYIVVFLTVPLVGLYFSLTQKGFVPAVLATVGLGLIVPSVVEAWALRALGLDQNPYGEINLFGVMLRIGCHLALALVLTNRLYAALEGRRFAHSSG